MKPTIKQPSNSQSVDRKVLLLLRRKGAQTIEGLTMLTGIGVGASLLISGPSQPDGKSLVDPRLPQ